MSVKEEVQAAAQSVAAGGRGWSVWVSESKRFRRGRAMRVFFPSNDLNELSKHNLAEFLKEAHACKVPNGAGVTFVTTLAQHQAIVNV